MSLDVTIKYKAPKTRTVKAGIDGAACGSTVAVYDRDTEVTEDCWSANITHNMGEMASHIPVTYADSKGVIHSTTLYMAVWRPEELYPPITTTDELKWALANGTAYMVVHRTNLLQYNPENGWGSYEAFLGWLLAYWRACIENPGCEIEVSR